MSGKMISKDAFAQVMSAVVDAPRGKFFELVLEAGERQP